LKKRKERRENEENSKNSDEYFSDQFADLGKEAGGWCCNFILFYIRKLLGLNDAGEPEALK
jgi:hypothetical protein